MTSPFWDESQKRAANLLVKITERGRAGTDSHNADSHNADPAGFNSWATNLLANALLEAYGKGVSDAHASSALGLAHAMQKVTQPDEVIAQIDRLKDQIQSVAKSTLELSMARVADIAALEDRLAAVEWKIQIAKENAPFIFESHK